MKERNYWVDYAKAIGIALVVYGHVARRLYDSGVGLPKKLFFYADSIIYSFHMPLFFFLSGLFFIGSLSKRGSLGLLSTKIDTIVYPYIIWSLIQGISEAFFSSFTNSDVSYAEVFSLFWQPRAQFWFLYALFLFFIFTILIFIMLPKRTAIFVLSLSSVILYLCPSILPYNVITVSISQNFVFFNIGIAFSLFFKREYLSNRLILVFLALCFVSAHYFFHYTLGLNYADRGILTLFLAIISIFFVVSLASWLSSWPLQLIIYIGSSSLAIYLMHILACSGIRIILNSFLGVNSFFVHLFIGCLFGMFAPLFALLILNKLNLKFLFSAPISQFLFLMN